MNKLKAKSGVSGGGGRGKPRYDDDEENDVEVDGYQGQGGGRKNANVGGGRDGVRDSRDRELREPARETNQWDRNARADDKNKRDTRDARDAKDTRGEYAAPPSPTPLIATGINLTNMKAFLTSPAPKGHGTIQCYIRRNKSGTNKLFPIYSLYMKVNYIYSVIIYCVCLYMCVCIDIVIFIKIIITIIIIIYIGRRQIIITIKEKG